MSEETPPSESTPEVLDTVPVDPQPPAETPAEPPTTETPVLLLSEHSEVPVVDAEIQSVSDGSRFHIALPERAIKITIAAAGGLIIFFGLSMLVWHHARRPSAGTLPPHVLPSTRPVAAPSPATPASSVDELRSWIDSLGTVTPGAGQSGKVSPAPVIAKAVPVPIPTATPTHAAAEAIPPTPTVAPVAEPTPTSTETPAAPAEQSAPAADFSQTPMGTSGLPEWHGTTTAIKEFRTVVVDNVSAWKKLWSEHRGHASTPPKVDFTQYVVVGVFGGEKPAGTAIAITGTEEVMPPALVISYRETLSSESAAHGETKTSSHPYSLWVIAQSSLPIRFEKTSETTGQ